MSQVLELGKRARKAARALSTISTKVKNDALEQVAKALLDSEREILKANREDVLGAETKQISPALIDRLLLNKERIEEMAQALRDIVALPDPVGEIIRGWKVPTDLVIEKVRVPLGVVGMIYEARPNVTVDGAGLCIKSGNAVILRGGSLALASNTVLANIIAEAGEGAGLPKDTVQSLTNVSREAANELMKLEYLDLLVPRGGPKLIEAVVENATVPVLWAGAGNCHVYVDKDADLEMASKIIVNAKCQRPSVCNAAETLLVHSKVAERFLPVAAEELIGQGVELFGCPRTRKIASKAKEATEEDWKTEYLDLKLAVKVVDSVEEAVDHINTYGTLHSEAIITENYSAARKFTEQVDAAAVFVNASTRFTDGGQFGLGAEIGISTQKLHARGPMGLEALTSTKYIVRGTGQIRE